MDPAPQTPARVAPRRRQQTARRSGLHERGGGARVAGRDAPWTPDPAHTAPRRLSCFHAGRGTTGHLYGICLKISPRGIAVTRHGALKASRLLQGGLDGRRKRSERRGEGRGAARPRGLRTPRHPGGRPGYHLSLLHWPVPSKVLSFSSAMNLESGHSYSKYLLSFYNCKRNQLRPFFRGLYLLSRDFVSNIKKKTLSPMHRACRLSVAHSKVPASTRLSSCHAQVIFFSSEMLWGTETVRRVLSHIQ